jgi:hypothetical protein
VGRSYTEFQAICVAIVLLFASLIQFWLWPYDVPPLLSHARTRRYWRI